VLAPLGAFGSAGPVPRARGVSDQIQTSADSKSLFRTPPCPPTCALSAQFPNMGPKMFRFRLTFCTSKIHENPTPPKTPPNLKNPTPERPKLDFWMIFGPLLALIFHQKSRHPENVCFETSIKRELRFSMPKPFILASIFNQISFLF
jgi:hypothetical protein